MTEKYIYAAVLPLVLLSGDSGRQRSLHEWDRSIKIDGMLFSVARNDILSFQYSLAFLAFPISSY